MDWSEKSISLNSNGDIIAIGANRNDGNGASAGHVRVYEYIGNSWIQRGVDINGESSGDLSGWSVSINSDGSILAIGAHENDGNGSNSGHVRVFEWNGTTWTQLGQDIDGEQQGDEFWKICFN